MPSHVLEPGTNDYATKTWKAGRNFYVGTIKERNRRNMGSLKTNTCSTVTMKGRNATGTKTQKNTAKDEPQGANREGAGYKEGSPICRIQNLHHSLIYPQLAIKQAAKKPSHVGPFEELIPHSVEILWMDEILHHPRNPRMMIPL